MRTEPLPTKPLPRHTTEEEPTLPPLLVRFALIFLVSVVLLVSQVLLKLGTRGEELTVSSLSDLPPLIVRVFTTPLLLLGYAISGIAAVTWLVVLSRMELSFALPVLNSMLFLLLLLTSAFILREHVGVWRWAGAALILLGMFLLARDSL